MNKDTTKRPVGDGIEQFHQIKLAEAKLLGRQLADRGHFREDDKLASLTSKLTDDYRSFMAQSLKPYAADATRLADAERANIQAKKALTEKKLAKAQRQASNVELDITSLPAYSQLTKKIAWIFAALIALCIGESYLTSKAFQIYEGSMNATTFLLFVVFGILYFLLPKTVIGFYRLTEDSRYKVILRLGLVTIGLFFLYTISAMRAAHVQSVSETTLKAVKVLNPHVIKSWSFISINLVFIVISCYVTTLLPNDDIKTDNNKAKALNDKLGALKNEIASYEAELDAIPDRELAIEQKYARQVADADTIRQRLNSLHAAAINTVISENRLYKTGDTTAPAYFEEIPSL